MDFGKLYDLKGVNFSLPPDHDLTAKTLATTSGKNVEIPTLYIGCTGWAMKEWVGKTYPLGAKSSDFLRHYAQQFNTIELNTTHYRPPTTTTIADWYSSTPQDFRFAPKMLQAISHDRNLMFGQTVTKEFIQAIRGLEEKLGVCFMQLPPHFSYEHLGQLERFLEKYAPHLPLAIEVRHEAWFSEKANSDALFSLLENSNVATVITDVAGRRDVLHQCLTTPTAVIRFVGNADEKALHATDYSRIDEWILRLKKWYEMGMREAYFFTHQPDNLLAPELADYTYQKAIASLSSINCRCVRFEKPLIQGSLF